MPAHVLPGLTRDGRYRYFPYYFSGHGKNPRLGAEEKPSLRHAFSCPWVRNPGPAARPAHIASLLTKVLCRCSGPAPPAHHHHLSPNCSSCAQPIVPCPAERRRNAGSRGATSGWLGMPLVWLQAGLPAATAAARAPSGGAGFNGWSASKQGISLLPASVALARRASARLLGLISTVFVTASHQV